jgi:hypothetical protein
VLVYLKGRLLVVDHLVPEAFTIDLVECHEADVARFREHLDVSQLPSSSRSTAWCSVNEPDVPARATGAPNP